MPPSSTIACLTETPCLKSTDVMSARMPGIFASVGVMTMDEHPISGARSTIDSVLLSFEYTLDSSGSAEILSSVVLTTLRSTPQARPMAESPCWTSPQYAWPSSTLMPLSRRSLATLSWEGNPSKASPRMSMQSHVYGH